MSQFEIDAAKLAFYETFESRADLKIYSDRDSVIVGYPAAGGGSWIKRFQDGRVERGILWGGDVWESHDRDGYPVRAVPKFQGSAPKVNPPPKVVPPKVVPPKGVDMSEVDRMTDDELFALSNRINRIESSMVTWRSFERIDTQGAMDAQYTELRNLRKRFDEQLKPLGASGTS